MRKSTSVEGWSFRLWVGVAIAMFFVVGAACGPIGVQLNPQPAPTSTAAAAPSPSPTMELETEVEMEQGVDAGAPRYDIDLDVDPADARVTGYERVRYTNAEDVALKELYLRLFPASPSYGGEMSVTRLLLDGESITPALELEGSAVRVPLESALEPGEVITLEVGFEIGVPTTDEAGYAQFAYVDGVMALPNAYPLIPVYDDEGWNVEIAPDYGDAVYSDIAFYQVNVSAPATMTLVASGSCTNPEPGRWDCSAGLMRDFVLVLGEEYGRASQVAAGIEVNSYYELEHEAGGRATLRIAADAVEVFSSLFGPYPYGELDVVETPTLAGGIEYPGLVVIAQRLYRGDDYMEWVVAHEVGHQWWYAVVGNDQVDEPWLDEALVQYSTLLYYETLYGSETAADILERDFQGAHEMLEGTGQGMPVGLPVAAYEPRLYGPVVYQKGPLYFHALRERVGDEAFFDILRTYYRRHRYGIATPSSFLTTVKIVTGDPHLDLFEEWISGTSAP